MPSMGGYTFSETMTGTCLRDGAESPIAFTLQARVDNLLHHLQDRRATIEGHIDLPGLANHTPLRGEMIIDPLLSRLIRYDFTFAGDDGGSYRFFGQKEVSVLDPVASMTTLPAEITGPDGKRIATCELRFDLRDLPSFLRSFRPVL